MTGVTEEKRARPSEEELADLNVQLTDSTPQEILRWAIERFGSDLALACSFGGISGMALLDMAVRIDPKIRVFYIDTDFLFPETYATRDAAIRRYGISPIAYKSKLTPDEQTAQHGDALWKRDPDACCALRKVEPNRRALEDLSAWITGLRRDQGATRKQVRAVDWDAKFNLYKISPLYNWNEDQVWAYINQEYVPYNPLHEQGYPSIGCTYCTRPVAPGEDTRAGRWSGTGKTECGLHK